MTLNDLKYLTECVWYLFLICLLIYLIFAVAYSFLNKVKRDREIEQAVNELVEKLLEEDKKE